MKEKKPAVQKMPKSLAVCADLLYTTRQNRLSIQKQVEELQRQESMIKDHIIQNLPKSQATGISGKLAHVTVVNKEKPVIKDYDAFYAHIKKTGEFDLMQRRVSDTAVKERWEAGEQVPGVEKFIVVDISMGKI